MYHGLLIMGLNGSGKTTPGRYLASQIGYTHMDIEDYYFLDSPIPCTNPRADVKNAGTGAGRHEKVPGF